MKIHTQFKLNFTKSYGVRLFILIVLASVLSSCGVIVETPVPTVPNYELTPTLQDPATQELTLVPPTEVATEMLTITLTPEPTAAFTLEPTEVIKEKYPIDLEKLSTTPESYQYLVDHKEEFVQGPDPLEVGVEEFYKWYIEKLIPSLGDMADRDVNVRVAGATNDEFAFRMSVVNIRESVRGQMEFWYFEHNGVVYPVFELSSQKNDKIGPYFELGVILIDNFGSQGLRAIEDIYNRQKIFGGANVINKFNSAWPVVSDDVHKMVDLGIVPKLETGHVFGIGAINFFEP